MNYGIFVRNEFLYNDDYCADEGNDGYELEGSQQDDIDDKNCT